MYAFTALVGMFAVYAVLSILLLVISDISAGALSGVPETGWGFVIALYFYGPIAAISTTIFIILRKRYAKKNPKPHFPILAASIFLTIGFSTAGLIVDKLSELPVNSHDETVSSQLEAVNNNIFESSAEHTGKVRVLPSAESLNIPAGSGITYETLSETRYKLCAEFEISNMKFYYNSDYPEQNAGIPAKVHDGLVLDSLRADDAFSMHSAGKQCYTIDTSI